MPENLEQKFKGVMQPAVPLNDKGVTTDKEFLQSQHKLIDRSKQLFWWRSVSKVFSMLSLPLLTAGMGVVIGCLTQNVPLNTMALGALFGGSALCLAVGIATDYFENLITQRQGYDNQDLSAKRSATHFARALNEVGDEEAAPALADKLRPAGQAVSWAEKTGQEEIPGSRSLH